MRSLPFPARLRLESESDDVRELGTALDAVLAHLHQVLFEEEKFIGKVEVYWYDDGKKGLCRTPESWRLLYLENGSWVEARARGGYGVEKDKFNEVALMPFASSKMRLEAKLRKGYSAGILEWRFR